MLFTTHKQINNFYCFIFYFIIQGKLYAVIGRRHGKILTADLIEGSGQFDVSSIIPVIESFNFAKEIRTQTSGLAMPQLVFSHWEV